MLELGWRPEIPDHLPEAYKSFVRQCWEEDREKVSASRAGSQSPMTLLALKLMVS